MTPDDALNGLIGSRQPGDAAADLALIPSGAQGELFGQCVTDSGELGDELVSSFGEFPDYLVVGGSKLGIEGDAIGQG